MSKPLDRLKHHVTGAIERGEAEPIEAVTAPKHTPGPWRWSKLHWSKLHQSGLLQIVGPNNEFICELHYHPEYNDNNTNLIAAAPEMLEALKAAQKELKKLWLVFPIVDDAIEKAEGKS